MDVTNNAAAGSSTATTPATIEPSAVGDSGALQGRESGSGAPQNPSSRSVDGVDQRAGSATVPKVLAEVVTGASVSPELLGEMQGLLQVAGSPGPEVCDFGDTFFEIGSFNAELKVLLTPTEKSALRTAVTDVAHLAGGRREATHDALLRPGAQLSSIASDVIARGGNLTGGDVEALVQYVLREAYIEQTQDLVHFAEKVKMFNETKKALRAHLSELRKIQKNLAAVTDEDAANTDLAGNPVNAISGELEQPPGDGEILVTSPEQRAADYPQADAAVAEFTGFRVAGGRTPLENLLLNDADAKQRLLSAIPYMTGQELVELFAALGGSDMVVEDELKPFLSEMANALSTPQLLELGTLFDELCPAATPLAVVRVEQMLNQGDLAGHVTGRVAAALATAKGELGRSFDSHADALRAWRNQHREAQLEQRRDTLGAADEGALKAMEDLLAANPDGLISGSEMFTLIHQATEDKDARAVSIELHDLRHFVELHGDRLTQGARKVFDAYDISAKHWESVGTIPTVAYDALMIQLQKVVSDHSATDATEVANHEQARTDSVAVAEDQAASREAETLSQMQVELDLDPSDGAIDAVNISLEPPYVRQRAGEKISTKAQLDAHVQELEESLNSIGDDAQLANVDMQNSLQKQQQTLQMMSNIAKMMHDTALNTIRKIGG